MFSHTTTTGRFQSATAAFHALTGRNRLTLRFGGNTIFEADGALALLGAILITLAYLYAPVR